jgi:hypothetical protein
MSLHFDDGSKGPEFELPKTNVLSRTPEAELEMNLTPTPAYIDARIVACMKKNRLNARFRTANWLLLLKGNA